MATLEQQRALLAHRHVLGISNRSRDEERKKYASIVHSMPALLRSAGLSQAFHFIATRKHEAQRILLDHFAEQLCRVDGGITDTESLLKAVRNAELGRYLRLSQEAILCADWYRRLVQGILKIEAGEADGTD